MPSYKHYYYCRRCSGIGIRGKRVWIKKNRVTTDPPKCPYCGGLLRQNPDSGAFKDGRYNFAGEGKIIAFAGALKSA